MHVEFVTPAVLLNTTHCVTDMFFDLMDLKLKCKRTLQNTESYISNISMTSSGEGRLKEQKTSLLPGRLQFHKCLTINFVC